MHIIKFIDYYLFPQQYQQGNPISYRFISTSNSKISDVTDRKNYFLQYIRLYLTLPSLYFYLALPSVHF